MSELKLFAPEWCDRSKEAVNAGEAMYMGIKDPDSFTNKMAFTCSDVDLACHLDWEMAKVVQWIPPLFNEGDLWLIITADSRSGHGYQPERPRTQIFPCRVNGGVIHVAAP